MYHCDWINIQYMTIENKCKFSFKGVVTDQLHVIDVLFDILFRIFIHMETSLLPVKVWKV